MTALDAAPKFGTLVDSLCWRAEHQPSRLAYRFLPGDESREVSLTYGQLDAQARAIAARLQTLQRPGERTLLVYPSGLEFVSAFLGCLYAGTVAVIVAPPHPARLSRFLVKTTGVCRDAAPAVALTTGVIHDLLEGQTALRDRAGALAWLATDREPTEATAEWHPPPLAPADLAFLQYTSGSTTEPRGVMVSHGNLVHNIRAIEAAMALPPESESVSWLPPQHDMGLIGGILVPLHAGMPTTLLPPASFVQRPMRWLESISRFKAAASCAPNFAYDLCVRRVTPDQRATLDLSTWRVAFTGAEPIHVQTLRTFADAFSPCGFNPTAFKPCYGLAEATLMVSAAPSRPIPAVRRVRKTDLARHLVVNCAPDDPAGCEVPSCGVPVEKVVIADPDRLIECDPERVGEVWVSGPSVAHGYWNRPDDSAATFGRHLEGHEGRFLRTGDLGFLFNGELFVTGRLKDLIIIDGANHYPQDIERSVVECHPALAAADCAAFSVDILEREELVVIASPSRKAELPVADLERVIRTVVAEQHDLRLREIVFVKTGRIPKTTSGKLRRRACRSDYLAGRLDLWGQP